MRTSFAVLVLLFAFALASRGLDMDAFSHDEIRSVVVAGGAHYGPLSYPAGVIQRLVEQSPDQAVGFALLARPWGALVGWTELALRVLPLLAGTLTIALTYRIGREMFSAAVGLSAALMLSTSALYIEYMHKFRVFTLASLAVAATLWAYWRLVGCPGKGIWKPALVFVAGGVGLFYSHYFAVPIMAGLGMYHLFFVPRDRRWWRVAALLALVLVLYLPEAPLTYRGVAFNAEKDWLQEAESLTARDIIDATATYFSNGQPFLLAGLLAVSLWRRVRVERPREVVLLMLVIVGMLGVTIGMNTLTGVILPGRVRYLLGMWVPLALFFAWAIHQTGQLHRWLPAALLTLWSVVGLLAISAPEPFLGAQRDERAVEDWRGALGAVADAYIPGDAVLLRGYWTNQFEHYAAELHPRHTFPPYNPDPAEAFPDSFTDAERVWLVVRDGIDATSTLATFATHGFDHCAPAFDDPHFAVDLFVMTRVFCPSEVEHAVFAGDVVLHGWDVTERDGVLVVQTGWGNPSRRSTAAYSVGAYLLDASGGVVAQDDRGLGELSAAFIPMQHQLPVVPGDVQLALTVYTWWNGTPLALARTDLDARDNLLLLGAVP